MSSHDLVVSVVRQRWITEMVDGVPVKNHRKAIVRLYDLIVRGVLRFYCSDCDRSFEFEIDDLETILLDYAFTCPSCDSDLEGGAA